ncbi:MAG: spermidine synthase, partial [Anaeromyxobacteraceae bacterium]
LVGYAYASWAVRRLRGRAQAAVHTMALLASTAALPIVPGDGWRAAGTGRPVLLVLGALALTVGAPFVLLSTTTPLAQAWFSRVRGRDPYRLYALSNAASLAALLAYPALIEPRLATRAQATLWSVAYLVFVVVAVAVAWTAAHRGGEAASLSPSAAPVAGTASGGPGARARALWFALAAAGSLVLLAVTNHVTQNVASVPLLWIVPLTLYLATYVVCFDAPRWYRPGAAFAAAAAALAGISWLLYEGEGDLPWGAVVAAYAAALVALCTFCHGELARRRPPPEHLGAFYVSVAAGGAAGACAVGVIAPLVLPGYYELAVALVACAALALVASLRASRLRAGIAGLLVLVTAGAGLARAASDARAAHRMTRSFYGALRVDDTAEGQDRVRRLYHGTVLHGEQWLAPERRREATTYYSERSGVGRALHAAQEAGPVRVGVIGLGAGTLAAYARPGDVFRFYEIDPAVIAIARADFTFLSDAGGSVEIAPGDARLTLEREPARAFDVLAVDAFSGDAIPVHLLTREALGIYLRHLAPHGLLAFHVSNMFLDLVPVVRGLAGERGLRTATIEEVDPEDDEGISDWVLVSRDGALLGRPAIQLAAARDEGHRAPCVWTDDFSSLLQVLK